MSASGARALRLTWQHGVLLGPNDQPLPLPAGPEPDIAAAHAAVDAWAARLDILELLPRLGDWSPWWYARFALVHDVLSRMLPQYRALEAARAQSPQAQVHLVSPPMPWWRALYEQDPRVEVQFRRASRLGETYMRRSARLARALLTEQRLRKLLPPETGRPRVLVVSQSRYWNGREDTLLQGVMHALHARGLDVRVLVQGHAEHSLGLAQVRQRPKQHLFGDVAYLRSLRARKAPLPAFTLPQVPLVIEGKDWEPVARRVVDAWVRGAWRERAIYHSVMPGLLDALRPRAAVLVDEQGGEHFLHASLVAQGVQTVAVQHGCIHRDHLHYLYPPGTPPEAVPLPTRTCVFGEHYRRLLVEESIYPSEHVVVTGAPHAGPAPASAEEVAKFRLRIMPAGTQWLVLFTSQDLLHALAAPRLLDALRNSTQVHLLIRPHPREYGQDHWERWVRKRGLERQVTVARGPSLSIMLQACDVHCSVSSTALGEAALFRKPNVVLGSEHVGDWMGVLEAGVAVELRDFPSLDAAVTTCLAVPRAAFEAACAGYATAHFFPQEEASAAIADITANLL